MESCLVVFIHKAPVHKKTVNRTGGKFLARAPLLTPHNAAFDDDCLEEQHFKNPSNGSFLQPESTG